MRAPSHASGYKANTGSVDCAVASHLDLAKFIRKEI